MAILKDSEKGREKKGLIFRHFTAEEITEIGNLVSKEPLAKIGNTTPNLYTQAVTSAQYVAEEKESILKETLGYIGIQDDSAINVLLDLIYDHFSEKFIENDEAIDFNPDEIIEFSNNMYSIFSLIKFISKINCANDRMSHFQNKIDLAKKGVLL